MTVPGCMVDGNPDAPLLIIGMAPGRDEIKNDKPFIGGSGKLLWKQLAKKAGVSRADCYIINTIGEWPEGIDGNPTKAQYDKYWDAFDAAVEKSKARVALLLGKAALWRFTGLEGGIEDWRGYLVGPDEAQLLTRTVTRESVYKTSNKKRGIKKGDPKVEKVKAIVRAPWPESVQWAIPALHPAAILRSGYRQLPALASDVARTGRALNGALEIQRPEWLDGVPDRGAVVVGDPVVVDIETGGIDNGIITRVGANFGSTAWTALWDNQAREALRWLLGSGPSVAFNIGFDAPRLAAHGVEVPEPWWDVMLAAATVEPDLKKSLNFVASLYMDKRRHKHLSDSDPAFYNAMDVADTLALYYILRAELERTGQLELFEKRMMPTLPVLVDMTQRGIPVDKEWRAKWIRELLYNREIALHEWEAIAPGQKTAGSGLLKYMYGPLGLPTQYHKHGGITSEVASIKKMLLYERLSDKQRTTLTTLLKLRGIEKELKTYAEIELAGDDRVHPSYLPAGKDTDSFGKGIAGTGRITSGGGINIQNQPKSARRMYVSSGPGRVLVAADFSQIEARIIAQLSGDDELRSAIRAGLHQSNMATLGVDKVRAKNGFYGWAYGAGKRTLANTFIGKGFDVREPECEALLRGFDRRFHVAAAWRRRIAGELAVRYYLTNAFGRRRYFLGGSRDTPAGLDFHPQSCAADIMWTILRPLADGLRELDAQILATVHDEVLVDGPADAVRGISKVMRDIMEQPWKELGGLVVPIEIAVGKSWAEMEETHG